MSHILKISLTFLFFTLILFGVSSAFAVGAAGEPTTYTYYANRSNTICSTDSESICAANPTNAAHVAGCSGFTTTCDTGAYYNYSLSTRSCTVNSSYSYYDYQRSSTYVFDTKTKVCEADEEFKLVGCTAECVPKENLCAERAGQKETRISQCGLLTGTDCTSKAVPDSGDTFTKTCAAYSFNWLPLSSKFNLGGCEAVVTKQDPLIKNNGNLEPNSIYDGSSNNIPLNCEIELTYTGEEYTNNSSSPPPASSPKSSTTGGSAKSHNQTGEGGTSNTNGTGGLKQSSNGTSDGVGTGSGTGTGDGGGGSTTGGGTGDGGGDTGTCDPTKSICEGSGDGSASTGDINKPEKIQNTVTGSWWESEYENGLQGIWDEHKANFDNTPFMQSLNSIKEGAPNSGSCPSFPFQFLQYSGNFKPPCFIWPALKAFFIFSTLMLCRRIIFGG